MEVPLAHLCVLNCKCSFNIKCSACKSFDKAGFIGPFSFSDRNDLEITAGKLSLASLYYSAIIWIFILYSESLQLWNEGVSFVVDVDIEGLGGWASVVLDDEVLATLLDCECLSAVQNTDYFVGLGGERVEEDCVCCLHRI